MVLPWNGSAVCCDNCKYGSTVPGGYTICTCSFVFEYVEIPSTLFPHLLSSLLCHHHASVLFSVGGKTGVFELSVQYVFPLSPIFPGLTPAVCFVQEVGTIVVFLFVPVETLVTPVICRCK